MFFLFKRIEHPSSANYPRNIKEELFNSGMMFAVDASFDRSDDKGISPFCVELMTLPSGIITSGPFDCFILHKTSVSCWHQ